jgi:hypothetical protein
MRALCQSVVARRLTTRGAQSATEERIAALCGVAPTLNEKHMWTGWVARISPTSFSATVSTSRIHSAIGYITPEQAEAKAA